MRFIPVFVLLLGVLVLAAAPARAQDCVDGAPRSLILPFNQAVAAEENGQFEKAGRLYERVFSVSGGEASILFGVASSFARAGQASEAINNLEQAVAAGLAANPQFLENLRGNNTWTALRSDSRWNAMIADAEERLQRTDQELRAELLSLAERDQENRTSIDVSTKPDSSIDAALAEADAPLQKRLKEIVDRHGWPTRSLVGDDGAHAAWLLVQHADTSYQEQVLPLLLAAAQEGEARAADAAFLHDRVLMSEERPQRYGTQRTYDEAGRQMLYPVEDEAHVDERRAEVGLAPLKEVLACAGIDYSSAAAQ